MALPAASRMSDDRSGPIIVSFPAEFERIDAGRTNHEEANHRFTASAGRFTCWCADEFGRDCNTEARQSDGGISD